MRKKPILQGLGARLTLSLQLGNIHIVVIRLVIFQHYYIMVDTGNLSLLAFEIPIWTKIVEDRRNKEVVTIKNVNLTGIGGKIAQCPVFLHHQYTKHLTFL